MRIRVLIVLGGLLALIAAPASAADTALSFQWGLSQIGAPAAWTKSTGAGVRIGIVDTGVDMDHIDLAGKVVAHTACLGTNGEAAECSGSGRDDHGHGTHVAGIAAAARDKGAVAGVAPDAQLVVAKVLDSAGSGQLDDIEAGVRWVVANGAQVVNLSLGDAGLGGFGVFCDNSGFKALLNEVWDAGRVPVFAAGNCGGGLLGGGANFRGTNALIVGATNRAGNKTSYTNDLYSAQWGLVAPGGEGSSCSGDPSPDHPCILSTFPSNAYAYLQGTSMAAPHVSGAVAVLLAQGHSKDQAVSKIMQTLSKGPCGDGCQGRLDLAKAAGAGASSTPAPQPTGGGGGGGGAGGGGGTTAPPNRSTARPGPAAAPAAPTTNAPTTVPATTSTTAERVEPLDSDALQAAPAPRQEDSDDDGVNGPLVVLATLGVLGVGGTAAPIVLRLLRLRGGAGP